MVRFRLPSCIALCSESIAACLKLFTPLTGHHQCLDGTSESMINRPEWDSIGDTSRVGYLPASKNNNTG